MDMAESRETVAVNIHVLARYLRKMAALLGADVPLMRTLDLLQATADTDLARAVTADLIDRLHRDYRLSEAMAEYPALFTPFAVAMVHVGEIAGRLEVTVGCLAYYYETALDFRERFNVQLALARLAGDDSAARMEERRDQAWTRARELLMEVSFCRALAILLEAGVPPVHAVRTVSAICPDQCGDAVQRLVAQSQHRDEDLPGELARSEQFSPLFRQLWLLGQRRWSMPDTARRAADLLEAETLAVLREALDSGADVGQL